MRSSLADDLSRRCQAQADAPRTARAHDPNTRSAIASARTVAILGRVGDGKLRGPVVVVLVVVVVVLVWRRRSPHPLLDPTDASLATLSLCTLLAPCRLRYDSLHNHICCVGRASLRDGAVEKGGKQICERASFL